METFKLISISNHKGRAVKRLLLPLLCFFILSYTSSENEIEVPNAVGGMLIGSGAVGGGSDNCPSGSYTIAWNGDHSGGTLSLCDSGSATNPNSATIGSSYGDTGNGLLVDSATDSIKIAAVWNNVGTIWVKFDPQYCGAADGNHFIFAFMNGTNNYDGVTIRHKNTGNIYVYYKWDLGGSGSQVYYQPGSLSCSAGTWEYLAISWDNTQSDGSDKLAIWYDGSWQADEATTLGTAWGAEPDQIELYGEIMGDDTFTDDEYYIDNFAYIAGTYQASNPW